MTLPFLQRVGRYVHLFSALTGKHYAEIKPLLEKHVPKDGVIIDVGAHAGHFTKLFSQVVPQGHVYAFEPGSYVRSIISSVISFKKLKNVSLFPMGLGDKPSGEAPHSLSGVSGGGCPVMGCGGTANDERITLTTLDQFTFRHNLKRVDFIRADIGGQEMRFLLGGHHVIEKFRPVLFLEINEASLQRAGNTADEVWHFLKALNYRIDKIEGDGRVLTPLSAPIAQGDIWCVAEERRKAA